MTHSQALAAIRAAGIEARYESADDESVDAVFVIAGNTDIVVQICGGGHFAGYFVGCFYSGVGDDWGVTDGTPTTDPVAAARDALRLAASTPA